MKTVANLGSLQQAQNLKLTLGSMGIESFIPDEISAGVAPHLFMTRPGVRLQVDEKDEEEARRIIQEELRQIDSEEAEHEDTDQAAEG